VVVIILIVSILAGIGGMNLLRLRHRLIETLGAPMDRLESNAVTRFLIGIPGLDCVFGIISWVVLLSAFLLLYCIVDTVGAVIRKRVLQTRGYHTENAVK
jgi:hypothetical protein